MKVTPGSASTNHTRNWLAAELRRRYPKLAARVLQQVSYALWSLKPPDRGAPAAGRPYRRARLAAAGGFEVLLMTWAPQGVSAIHDHAGGGGDVFLLEGALVEQRWPNEAAVRAAAAFDTRALAAPAHIAVAPAHFHQMSCVGDHATTLHIYFGVGATMRLADPERRSTLLVPASEGAWLPEGGTPRDATPWK